MSENNEEARREDQEGRERARPRVVDKRVASGGGESRPTEPKPQTSPGEATAAPDEEAPPPEDLSSRASARPEGWTPEQEAQARRMAEEMAQVASLDWVVNAAVTFANVAATKLDRDDPKDAQLAIDALAALVGNVGDRLGEVEAPLRQTLAQLQMVYTEKMTARG